MKYAPIMERLERLSVPEPNTGCWLWLGAANRGRSPRIGMERRAVPLPAHRVAWEHRHGRTVPPGVFVRCRHGVQLCVNPEHQELRPQRRHVILKPTRQSPRGRPQKLNDAQVRMIRDGRAAGLKLSTLAQIFDVTEGTISRIVNNLIWREND